MFEPVFSTISTNLASPELGITACGVLTLSRAMLQDAKQLKRGLDELHSAACRPIEPHYARRCYSVLMLPCRHRMMAYLGYPEEAKAMMSTAALLVSPGTCARAHPVICARTPTLTASSCNIDALSCGYFHLVRIMTFAL